MLSHVALLILGASSHIVAAQNFLFSFGDSYTTTGFDINGVQASLSNPIGNPAWNYSLTYQNVQSTSAGGPNYIDWLITQYNASLVQSYNFAYSGATINNSLATRNGPPDLLTQISNYYMPKYSTPGNSVAPWSASNSVFLLCFGINEYDSRAVNVLLEKGDRHANGFSIDVSWYNTPASTLVPKLISSYMNALGQLYQTGARNFVILNVPPFDRSPYAIRGGSGTTSGIANYITQFNSGLSSNATAFATQNSGSKVTVYDYNSYMSDLLNSPSAYGFTDATCEDAGYSNCVWWRNTDLHPTSTFHRNLAVDVANSGVLGTFAKTGNAKPGAVQIQTKSVSAFCPTDNAGNYTTASGDIYNIQCQYAFAFDSVLEQTQQATLQACLLHCSQWNLANAQKCLGANFYGPGGTCYLKNNTNGQAPYDVDSGLLVSPPAKATGTPSSSSAAASASASPPAAAMCPGADGTTYVDSDMQSYKVICNTYYDGSMTIDSSYTADLAGCLLHCSDYNVKAGKQVCLGATFYPYQYNCWLANGTALKHSDPNYNSGQLIGPSSASTTTSAASSSAPTTSPSASASSTANCPSNNGMTYTDSDAQSYQVICSTYYDGSMTIDSSYTADLAGCLLHCSDYNVKAGKQVCLGATFYPSQYNCWLANGTALSYSNQYYNSGKLISAAAASASPTTSISKTSSAAAAPSTSASSPTANCPANDGMTYVDSDGISYRVLCSTNWDGSLTLDSTYTADLAGCLLHCSDLNVKAGRTVCYGATFYPSQYNCWTVNGTTTKYSTAGYSSGLRLSPA